MTSHDMNSPLNSPFANSPQSSPLGGGWMSMAKLRFDARVSMMRYSQPPQLPSSVWYQSPASPGRRFWCSCCLQFSYAIKKDTSGILFLSMCLYGIKVRFQQQLMSTRYLELCRPMRALCLVCIRCEVERSCPQNATIEVLQFVREKIFSKEKSGSVPEVIKNSRKSKRQLVNINVKISQISWLEEHSIKNLETVISN